MLRYLVATCLLGLFVACNVPVQLTPDNQRSQARALGTVYYVDLTGSDTTGTGASSSPWRTLAYATSRVAADQGALIQIGAGTFVEAGPIAIPTGVSLAGSGSASTVLRFGGGDRQGNFILLNSANIHKNGNQSIRNLAIDGNSKAGGTALYINARDNVTLDGLAIRDFKETAITAMAEAVTGAPSFTLTGLVITNNVISNCSMDNRTWSTGDITISGLTGAIISNNTINETGGYGIKFGNSFGGLYGVKVQNNVINVNPVDAAWGSDCGIELWNAYLGTEVSGNQLNTWMSLVNEIDSAGTTSLLVHDNRIVSPLVNNPKEGIEAAVSDAKIYNNYIEQSRWGIAMWQEQSRNNQVYNNVMYNRSAMTQDLVAGIYLFPQSGNMSGHKFYNNVIEGYQHGFWLKGFTTATLTNIEIVNNIVQNLTVDPTYGVATSVAFWITDGAGTSSVANFAVKNNLTFNAGPTVWNGTPTALVESGNLWNVNPQLTGSGTRPSPFYVPATGSVVIDAGLAVGLPFDGTAPDIGAFEGVSGGVATVAAPTFSPNGGTYTSPQTVSISTATSGATIRYTTNGSNPTSTLGTVYTGPITVSVSQTIKAIAYKTGLTDSSVATVGFQIVTIANLVAGGSASASLSSQPGETAASAFDGNSSTKWKIASKTGWLLWDWTGSVTKTVVEYRLTSAPDSPTYDPKSWTFEGSQDGTVWTVLDTRTAQSFSGRGVTNTYTITNSTAFAMYRLNISANNGNAGVKVLQVAELGLFGY